VTRRRAIVAAIAVSLVLTACGGSKDDKSEATTTTRRAKTTTTVNAAAAKLEAKLIKTVPAGYKQEADDVGDTGPSDLDKAARDDGDPDARAVLTRFGFVAGYQRYWTKGDDEIIDFLYEFSNATGTNEFLKRETEGLGEGDEETTVTEFTVTGIPGAKGFMAHSAEGDAVVVVFARGTYAAQVVVNGTDATQANAQSLAKQQYDNLA
jgi:hypothetical protein